MKIKTAAVVLCFILASTALPATSSTPSLAISPKSIYLEGATESKTFRVWNSGSGKLTYTVSIDTGEAYFKVSPTQGDSNNSSDVRIHTVDVNYNAMSHNATVTGRIKVSDTKTSLYIDLSATDTVASHVRSVTIDHIIDCNSEQDCNESVYKFRMNIVTDYSVAEINFVSPDSDSNEPYTITDDNYIQDGQIETWHSSDSSRQFWTYQATFPEYNDLTAYWNGKYIIGVTYVDSNQAQAEVGFSIPQRPGAIPQPTQEPNITFPADDSNTVSPVRFAWEKCSDSNVGSILVGYKKSGEVNWIEHSYGKSAVKTGAFKLDYGRWLSELVFGRWYDAKNPDGIEITVGKSIKSYASFGITNQFGTFDEFSNHSLQLTDCYGHIVTFNLAGGGEGIVVNDCNFDSIIIDGTTEKSVLSITTAAGVKTSVGNITVHGPIKSIIGRNVNLRGDIAVDYSAAMIALGDINRTDDINGTSQISIGSPELPKTTCVLNFDRINRLALSSGTSIKTLSATEWLSGSLDAPWISSMTIKGNKAVAIAGDFNATMTLSGEGSPKEVTLKTVRIAGNLGPAAWDITGSCGTIQVARELGETTWNIDGNCGTIQIAESNAEFEAGITGHIETLKVIGNKKLGIPSVLSGTWSFESVKAIIAATLSGCAITSALEDINSTAINSIAVTGWIDASNIATTGSVGSIIAGGIRNSTISGPDEDDPNSRINTLGQMQIKGIKDEAYCLINSNLSAKHIGKAVLTCPKYFNEGTSFGITAGAIDKLTIIDPAWTRTWKNLPAEANSIVIEDLKINLQ